MEIFKLVYTSKIITPTPPDLMESILTVSRRLNVENDITGFLVIRDGYFLQLLEGEESKVGLCFSRISKDPRHTQVILQGTSVDNSRFMTDWSMACVKDELVQTSSNQLIALFELGRMGKAYEDTRSLMAILKMFARDSSIFE